MSAMTDLPSYVCGSTDKPLRYQTIGDVLADSAHVGRIAMRFWRGTRTYGSPIASSICRSTGLRVDS